MSKTSFSGPIRTGKITGIPGQDTMGTLVATQQCTCSSAALKNQIVLPANCQPLDFFCIVTGSAGQVPGMNVFFGTSSDQSKYATIKASATGITRPLAAAISGQAVLTGFGNSDYNVLAIETTAQASATALVGWEAIVGITYVQRS